ncbi:MAG: DUF814 domain-containing protein [Candidatus Altiarchaeota archaeon]|nr:DUF814 domain-containing protein [Candidatus Altiarchaeota archaeon]
MATRIRIDYRKSVSENAQFYYSGAKKARLKLEGAKKALADTRKKIKELEEEGAAIQSIAPPPKKTILEKKWYDKFHHFNSSDGFFIVGGKDATTNEILIKKHLEKDDMVFHALVHGAPFFVIKNPGNKEIPKETLQEAAEAAASYSKAWKLGMGSCDVYCVDPEQVSKAAPSGEYLAKGAFMITGKKKWFKGTRLHLAVGFKVNDEAEAFCGPETAVKAITNHFAVIVPGDLKSGELAKKLKEKILKCAKDPDAGKIKKLSLEDIQRLIPGGKGRILSK